MNVNHQFIQHLKLVFASTLGVKRARVCLGPTRFILQAAAAIAVLFTPVAARAAPPGSGWKLTFSDDFDGTALNTNKWTPCYWWSSNGCTNGGSGDLQWYQPDEVVVDNGVLRLRAQKRSMNGHSYTSGMIASHDKYAFQYGYAEMRAKLPKGRGLWATFWLLSQQKIWPPEVDIAEYLGHDPKRVHMTLHYSTTSKPHESSPTDWAGPDFSADYHTFAVQWEPDRIIWYVDGVERKRYEGANIPNAPMYLVASLALGAAWTNTPPDGTTPRESPDKKGQPCIEGYLSAPRGICLEGCPFLSRNNWNPVA